MPRSILVGIDGSAHSWGAVEFGIQWAHRYKAVLVGLGVVDEPTICRPEPVPLGAAVFKKERDQALLAEARKKVDGFLATFAERCAGAGVSCTILKEIGLPAERILLEAQRYDLILLGQKTYFHFETQERADETLTLVVKHSPRPVVVAPELSVGGNAVLIAYDGSLQAARTLQGFEGAGLDGSQELHVVSVHPDAGEAGARADRAVDFLRFHGVAARRHALGTAEPPAQVLLEQISRLDAGLLVMGAYGQPTLKEFFFGSVTRRLLEQSPVPIFLYH
jgi:nucleotide-binding universal stress UspA family protein